MGGGGCDLVCPGAARIAVCHAHPYLVCRRKNGLGVGGGDAGAFVKRNSVVLDPRLSFRLAFLPRQTPADPMALYVGNRRRDESLYRPALYLRPRALENTLASAESQPTYRD